MAFGCKEPDVNYRWRGCTSLFTTVFQLFELITMYVTCLISSSSQGINDDNYTSNQIYYTNSSIPFILYSVSFIHCVGLLPKIRQSFIDPQRGNYEHLF